MNLHFVGGVTLAFEAVTDLLLLMELRAFFFFGSYIKTKKID